MTSRVVPFVVGFALASVIAWLGSQPSGDAVSATPETESVAPAVGTVVTRRHSGHALHTRARCPSPRRRPPHRRRCPRAPVRAARATAAPQPPAPSAPPSAERRRPAVSGYRGALVLNSNPEGAEVLLNGKVVGQTPVVLNDLPAGSRALLIRRDGYTRGRRVFASSPISERPCAQRWRGRPNSSGSRGRPLRRSGHVARTSKADVHVHPVGLIRRPVRHTQVLWIVAKRSPAHDPCASAAPDPQDR